MHDWTSRWASISLLVGTSLATSSCLFQKKPPRAFRPPPVAARVPPDTTPVVLPAPPENSTEVAPGEDIHVTAELPPLPGPPKPVPPAKPPATATPAVSVPNAGVVGTPPPAPPKPVQIYTTEERRAFLRDLEDSMSRVQRALAYVENRSLNTDQRDIVNRIKTFQQQAEQERDRDLAAAVSLARRADLLARDLLSRLP